MFCFIYSQSSPKSTFSIVFVSCQIRMSSKDKIVSRYPISYFHTNTHTPFYMQEMILKLNSSVSPLHLKPPLKKRADIFTPSEILVTIKSKFLTVPPVNSSHTAMVQEPCLFYSLLYLWCLGQWMAFNIYSTNGCSLNTWIKDKVFNQRDWKTVSLRGKYLIFIFLLFLK